MTDRLPLRYSLPINLMIAAAFWWVIAIALSCCIAWHGDKAPAQPQPPAPLLAAHPATMEDVVAPPITRAAMAMIGVDTPAVFGQVRQLYPSSECASATPLPFIVPAARVPRVGQEWECVFLTSACPVPAEPNWWAWIVASTKPPGTGLPLSLEPIGLHGCWLLVNPDQIISLPPGFEAPPGSMLTRDPAAGKITFRWTPAAGMAGQQLWMQLLVNVPAATPDKFLLSYAIELTVGS